MIGIIDYKAGNAPSVLNALHKLGYGAKLIKTSDEVNDSSKIILPGVGSAKATMDSLNELGFVDDIKAAVLTKGVPFLGICIGMQVLFEHSEEGDTRCLGWIKGTVKRFIGDDIRVPQIGWNRAEFAYSTAFCKNRNDYFYFVNSYYCVPEDTDIILARTEYGESFCSAISHKNITATQFHIEKSGEAGLYFLNEFAKD